MLVDVTAGRRQERAMRDTWGHLDAEPGVKYHGSMHFAEGAYASEQVILRVDFGDHAGDGPWFYEAVHAWLSRQHTEPGTVYRFDGWYCLDHDNNHQFVGETTVVDLGDAGPVPIAQQPSPTTGTRP